MENIVENQEVSQETPVTEAQTKEAAAEAPAVEQEGETVKEERVVPLGALHEERNKRKELAKKVEQIERDRAAQLAVLNDRLQQLYAMNQPQQNLPDPNDPLAVHEHEIRRTQAELNELRQRQQNDDAQRQYAHQVQQLVGWAGRQASEYVKEAPDWRQAYDFVAGARAAMHRASGLDHHEALTRLQQDEIAFYADAHRTGRNPAEAIYELAKSMGYKGKQGEQKIETLQKGVKASQTLAGGAPSGNPTPEQIAAMTDEQFAEFKAGLTKKGKNLSDVL